MSKKKDLIILLVESFFIWWYNVEKWEIMLGSNYEKQNILY